MLLQELAFDCREDVGMLFEEISSVVTSLANPLFAVAVPGARLVDDAGLDAEVDDVAVALDALAEEDVELGLPERRRDLVLDDLDARRLPMTSSPSLIAPMRRMSRRTEA